MITLESFVQALIVTAVEAGVIWSFRDGWKAAKRKRGK